MRTIGYCLLCLLLAGLPVNSRNLTILLDCDQPLSDALHQSLNQELKTIMADAKVNVDLRLRADIAEHEQFSQLVLFHLSGQCSLTPLPVAAVSDERGALAMTFASEGETLPFGEVRCDRLRTSVLRTMSLPAQVWADPKTKDHEYGVALARVMAHEIYHMLGHTTEHTKSGVTKRALTSAELSGSKLGFSDTASARVGGSYQNH